MEENDLDYHLQHVTENAVYMSLESGDKFLPRPDKYLKEKTCNELSNAKKLALEANESTIVSDNKTSNMFRRYVDPVTNELKSNYLCQVALVTSKHAADCCNKIINCVKQKNWISQRFMLMDLMKLTCQEKRVSCKDT